MLLLLAVLVVALFDLCFVVTLTYMARSVADYHTDAARSGALLLVVVPLLLVLALHATCAIGAALSLLL